LGSLASFSPIFCSFIGHVVIVEHGPVENRFAGVETTFQANFSRSVGSEEGQDLSIEPGHVLVLKRSLVATKELVEAFVGELGLKPLLVIFTVDLVLVSLNNLHWNGTVINLREIERDIVSPAVTIVGHVGCS